MYTANQFSIAKFEIMDWSNTKKFLQEIAARIGLLT